MAEDKTERLKKEIGDANQKIDKYWGKSGSFHARFKNVPAIKFVFYNRTLYPIIYETDAFYYLGGKNAYILLKSKCRLVKANESYYYEVVASDHDIAIGKSPIIPVGCPKDKGRFYPDDMDELEIRLSSDSGTAAQLLKP
jgi:hypothetical protein